MARDANIVRRSDLMLRCRYIGLETDIYELKEYCYMIHCKNYKGNFHKLIDEFEHSIRMLGTWVNLTQEPPEDYLAKLEPIPISNAADGFRGAYITKADLENAIIDRFPDVNTTTNTTRNHGIALHRERNAAALWII